MKLEQSGVRSLVEQVADAVLYEGYILYPYRASATKNQQRWNFGALCPPAYALAQKGTEQSTMQTQCLVEARSEAKFSVKVRFLQLCLREVWRMVSDCGSLECEHFKNENSECFEPVRSMELNGRILQAWQEAIEREVSISDVELESIRAQHVQVPFLFPGDQSSEVIVDEKSGRPVAMFIRRQEPIEGLIDLAAVHVARDSNNELMMLSVRITNSTLLADAEVASRDQALMRSTVSTHTILQVKNSEFVSLLDPPERYKLAASRCVNLGTYPVLVGVDESRDCVLSSPIILYDYPQIAPQSAGELYDGTEIDEILTLRIMTLSEDEKREMRSVDERARKLLERTETMQVDQMLNLHGVMKRT